MSLVYFNCSSQITPIQVQQPNLNSEILGSWVSNDDPNHKLVFSQNGSHTVYYNNLLSASYTYSITTQCKSQTLRGNYNIFLKITDTEDNETYCQLLNGIHTDENGVKTLSITIDRGKLYLYTKQE